MKIAIVYDRVTKYGGAERVLEALHELWPDAPLYTAVYDKSKAQWADIFAVHTSFLQNIPFVRSHHELFPWLTPIAFETFSFEGYDCVISVTSAEAKSIITPVGTCHICYCLTPTRYLWSGENEYDQYPGFGYLNPLVRFVYTRMKPILKKWDTYAASRVDTYIAISNTVKRRIEQYYHQKVDKIIYPPVAKTLLSVRPASIAIEPGFYLTVSRFVGYKRLDLLIDAFNTMQKRLVIIGSGREYTYLKQRAGKTITFVSHHLTEAELAAYYQKCTAFIYAAEEDFGLAACEAQCFGKPVIAYGNGGLGEVVTKSSGVLFWKQTVEDVVQAVNHFEQISIHGSVCKENGKRFSFEEFQQTFAAFVYNTISDYKRTA